jgi:type IV secretion system protein VirD4
MNFMYGGEMLLDELPAYQYLPFVDKCLNHGRAFNISLLGVAVSIEKLRATYPKSWKTFLGSDLVIFCGFAEAEVRSYLSKALGNRTICVQSSNQSYGVQQKFANNSSSKQEGDSLSETSRALLTEDELASIKDKVIIALVKDSRPIICHKAVYYKDRAWKGLWDDNPLEGN